MGAYPSARRQACREQQEADENARQKDTEGNTEMKIEGKTNTGGKSNGNGKTRTIHLVVVLHVQEWIILQIAEERHARPVNKD